MSTTMHLGVALGFSGAAALKGFNNLSKTASAFKAQVENIKGSKKLIDDLKASEKELARLKSQSTTKLSTSGIESQIIKLRKQLKAAGVDTNKLKQATHELNAKLAKTRFGQSQEAFQQAQSKVLGTAAVGYIAAKPLMASAKVEDDVRDISITGEFDATQEANLSKTIRSVSLQMNQTTDAVSSGLKSLVAGGIQSADELNKYAPVIAKTATATRAEMEDISNTFLALSNNMKISAADSEAAMNIMVKSTKLGQVEFADMSKWVPQLTPMLSALGMTGKESVAQLASMLQVAKIGAGTADEAGNNLKNLLTKITAPDTVKDFEKVGINLQESLKQSAANGIDPITAMLGLVEKYMSTALTGKDLVTYKEAISEKDNAKSAEMFKSLAEAGNMGQLFQDMQAMSALRAMLQNKDKLQTFSSQSLAAANSDLLGNDFAKRTETLNEQWKGLNIAASEFNLSVGSLFLEPIKTLTGLITNAAEALGNFVKNNPKLAEVAGYVLAGVAAFKALSLAILLVKGASLVTAGAITILNTAIRANPLVALITGIAIAATLIYTNWEPIKAWFVNLWQDISDSVWEKTALMSMTVEGWINSVKTWFGDLKTWFNSLWQDISDSVWEKTALMSMTIEGWINSVKTWFGDLKTWFNSLWQDILSGIDTVKKALNTVLPKKYQMHMSLPKPNTLPVPDLQPTLRAANDQRKSGDTIHFSPNIVLPVGTPEQTVSTVKQALGISQREFEQRYKQMQRNNQRLNFATE